MCLFCLIDMMDEVLHWNELPAQVDAILSEVWAKLDVDKQLQQAQDKIDDINSKLWSRYYMYLDWIDVS